MPKRLDGIYDYIRRKSERAAAKLYNNILDEAHKLIAHPQIAAIEPLLDAEAETYRSLVVRRNYKIVYRVEKETIYIIDIWDCRQNPKKLKKRVVKNK